MLERRFVAVAGARFEELDIEKQVLGPVGVAFRRTPGALAKELVQGCAGAVAVLTAAHPKFTREVLEHLGGVKAIVRYGVGVDSIDLEAASDLGIMVCNVPDFGIEEVAIHTVALALALIRRLHQALADTRVGFWDLGRLRPMHSPAAMVAGIVGLGRIGRATARHLAALGFRTLGYDPFVPVGELPDEPIVNCASLAELFAKVDLLSLHVPVANQTRGLINGATLRLLKKGTFIVNTSRGELIDEAALMAALDSGDIAGAALDVLSSEPPLKGNPLLAHPHVIVTPHAAWSTVEAETRLRRMAAEEVARVLASERPLNLVNTVRY